MHGSTKQRSFSRTITAQISFFRHELKLFDAGRSTCKYSRVNRNCPKAKYSFSCAASRPLSNRLRLPLFSFVSEELRRYLFRMKSDLPEKIITEISFRFTLS